MRGKTGAALCALLAGLAGQAAIAAPAATDGASAAPAVPAAPAAGDLASRFGAREHVGQVSLAPDGAHIAYISATQGRGSAVRLIDVAKQREEMVDLGNGERLTPSMCGWASSARLVCKFRGVADYYDKQVGYSRLFAFDADGGHPLYLGRKSRLGATRLNQFDGDVIDWRAGDGWVLMQRDFIPERGDGFNASSVSRDGLGVELVDSSTGKAQLIERPVSDAEDWLADGQGHIRVRETMPRREDGELKGDTVYSYRPTGQDAWKPFSTSRQDGPSVLEPLAVDGTRDVAFATRRLDGRLALYSVALDGSMKADLVWSNPEVDVGGIARIGRHGRVIGATYVTDRRQTDYFDPEYKTLAAKLAKALPKSPLIGLVGATADESRLLVYAGSDVDPGMYYLYTKAKRTLDPLIAARPELEGVPLGQMTSVKFPAADGTMVPGYLTLPPGGATKGLPAIVMPHGGPAYRDEWGFDWLVQFFAASGYAVLQPQFRGSTGYGDAWFANNGFRSWELAIGDVSDAGRWLVKQGIADPARLGILGWSYGGYAALQSNVVDPDLFKAVVAIAPVTDLGRTKQESEGFSNHAMVERQIGSGENIGKGSPARHADRFKAPVLLFHGDRDLNVGVGQSKLMDKRLRGAGKASTLVVYEGLDHQLDDDRARAEMLRKSDGFLRAAFAGK
ncbi:alpha/beta fold hydrolase [Sphingomonas sp. RRHST34]|uniref:Alpha/beta fold hydrolase n=1 Tax=Sphingomonas citri TaxID=2862499 RepID=A0ABS7BRS3_9SPHN|nr:alpha/beta fold hydrolase [Sphingomonas citri]MBW6532281.1 alpha/beta fold hydrolase [Sphingomonas citri]